MADAMEQLKHMRRQRKRAEAKLHAEIKKLNDSSTKLEAQNALKRAELERALATLKGGAELKSEACLAARDAAMLRRKKERLQDLKDQDASDALPLDVYLNDDSPERWNPEEYAVRCVIARRVGGKWELQDAQASSVPADFKLQLRRLPCAKGRFRQVFIARNASTREPIGHCTMVVKEYIERNAAIANMAHDLDIRHRAVKLVKDFNAAAAGAGVAATVAEGEACGWLLQPAATTAGGQRLVLREQRLRGSYTKWVNNVGHVLDTGDAEAGASRLAQALAHFSIHRTSQPRLGAGAAGDLPFMLLDVQGESSGPGMMIDGEYYASTITITDAALSSWQHLHPSASDWSCAEDDQRGLGHDFGDTDCGFGAINAFLANHTCGPLCHRLRIAGWRPSSASCKGSGS